MNKKNANILFWLDSAVVAIIVVAFFVISYCGFFCDDDLYMKNVATSLFDVFKQTKIWYFRYSGRLFSVSSQFLFSGVLGNNKIWFDIVNTIFFASLILICGSLINDNKKEFVSHVVLFALFFWFLCPAPNQTLFWVAGATTYLWANTLAFAFLLLFQKYKDDSFDTVGKLGLFFISMFAATEFITCASICGAFVVYYAIHIKRFKGNAVPFVIGFAIGSLFLLFAPGNFGRLETGLGITRKPFDIHYLLHHVVEIIVEYKTLWLLLIVLVWGWRKSKKVVKAWMKNNSILLLSLGWSLFAYNVVFSCPENRALFFTETLALILFLRFLYDNHGIIHIQLMDVFMNHKLSLVRTAVKILLFVLLLVDSVFAVVETKKQSENNDTLLNEIVKSGGIVALDRMIPSHRMAYVSNFHSGTWKYLADKYNLDYVQIYPFYCLDKYYNHNFPSNNVYIDDYNVKFEKNVTMIVRIEKDNLQNASNHVVFTIDYYKRPRNWYESLLDKMRNFHYNLTEVVEKGEPAVCFENYCYYVFYPRRLDAINLKSVEYEIE